MRGNVKNALFMTLFSLGVLFAECVLTRIFSLIFWYHFSFLVLSTALLGLGFGGLLIRSYRDRLDRLSPDRVLGTAALLSGITLIAAFWLITHNPVHPSDAGQSPGTIGLYTVVELVMASAFLFIPFTLMGAATVYILQKNRDRVNLFYGANLMGSALGCLAALVVMNKAGGMNSLVWIGSFLALLSAWMSWPKQKILSCTALAGALIVMAMSPYYGHLFPLTAPLGKAALKFTEEALEAQDWTSLAKVDVFNDIPTVTEESGLWGLSPTFKGPYPEKKNLLIDSLAWSPIIHHKTDPGYYRFLDNMPMYAVYAISPEHADVLVIGAGGGMDIRAGLEHGARSIDAVEINPSVITFMTDLYADYSGNLYQDNRVRTHRAEGRRFMESTGRMYDLIQLTNTVTCTASPAGAYAFSENYLYTREAFQQYFDHLNPEGMVCVTLWYLPSNTGYPRFSLRLFCLAYSALADQGLPHPENNLLFFESRGFAVLLAKKTAFSHEDIETITGIAQNKQYRMIYRPDKTIFRSMAFYSFVKADNKEAWFSDYPLQVSPPTDNAPFYFETRKTGSVFSSNKAIQGYSRFDGQTILMILMTELLVVALVLVWASFRMGSGHRDIPGWMFFGIIGLGFMLTEVALSQQLVLFLGDPSKALSVVLLSMLTFAGAGSLASPFMAKRLTGGGLIGLAAICLGVYAFSGLSVIHSLMGMERDVLRVLITMAMTGLPSFFMGMAFPLGVRTTNKAGNGKNLGVYWAWNGTGSVAGSTLAMIVAISSGFQTALALAAMSYLLAAVLYISLMKR